MLVSRWGGLPGTATFRSVNGYEGWSTESQLIAAAIDDLGAVAYYSAKAAGFKARKPTPLQRPWDRPKTFGAGAVPYDEIDAWMQSTWQE